MSIDEAQRILIECGYPVTSPIKKLLSSYSGLDFDRSNLLVGSLYIDGARAARALSHGWPEEYARFVDRPLVPVGEFSPMIVLVDANSGEIWGGFDYQLGQIGSSFPEALASMISPPGQVLDLRLSG